MNTTKLAALVVAVAALAAPATAGAEPGVVKAPTIPGVAALPGPFADPGKPAADLKVMKTTPDIGVPGTATTFSATGLPASKSVTLVWQSATVDWLLDARADSVDYLGRKTTKTTVAIANASTDASGNLSIKLKAPQDFGGIHEVYAVVDGVQVAKGGFLVARSASISPKSGPIGTMITVNYSGLGSSLYEGGGSLLYDNKYAGAVMANWTRGVAKVHIRAAGPVGMHSIEIADAITFKYLNIEQSPVPWATGFKFDFKVTADNGRPKARIDWPAAITPTVSSKTTLDAAGLTSATQANAALSSTSGQVLTKVDLTASGLVAGVPVSMEWATVVGNRVNCTGTCWSFVTVPLGNGTTAADGTLKAKITVPDGLGGWHVVQVKQAGEVKAQVPYYVKRSIVGNGG